MAKMIKIGHLVQKKNATEGQVTIDVLPDDVLLSVFECHLEEATDVEDWRTLVHVCRRWQNVVFGSSRRLRLRIAFTDKSHVKEKLDVWPGLPIVVSGYCDSEAGLNNIKAALEHSDRICQIELAVNERMSMWNVFTALEKPFPALTDLDLSQWPFTGMSDYPDPLKFLGSSSHLRSLSLGGIAIPQFPALLASFADLNNLHLHNITHYGYFKPDAMATTLSTLTSLKTLSLRFKFGLSLAALGNQASQHNLPCSVIPSLFCFDFEGVSEYLEAFVARIDTPVLDRLGITLSCQPKDTTQLRWYLSRIPNLQAFDEACVKVDYPEVWTDFSSISSDLGALRVRIPSNEPGRFPSLTQCFDLPFNPTPESLHIVVGPYYGQSQWAYIKNDQWVNLLRPFVAVKNLHLSKLVARLIAPALGDLVGARATEVLPVLQNIFLGDSGELLPSGPTYGAIMRFTTARRLSGHTIHIVPHSRDSDDH